VSVFQQFIEDTKQRVGGLGRIVFLYTGKILPICSLSNTVPYLKEQLKIWTKGPIRAAEWKVFVNFFPQSAFWSRFTCHGEMWRKSAVAKLSKSNLALLTKEPRCRGHVQAPHFAPT